MILRIIIIIGISITNILLVNSKHIANTATSELSEQESDKGIFENLSDDIYDGNQKV